MEVQLFHSFSHKFLDQLKHFPNRFEPHESEQKLVLSSNLQHTGARGKGGKDYRPFHLEGMGLFFFLGQLEKQPFSRAETFSLCPLWTAQGIPLPQWGLFL